MASGAFDDNPFGAPGAQDNPFAVSLPLFEGYRSTTAPNSCCPS